jgi:ABC-type multidrug transport system, ATPase and permease components
MTIRTEQKNTTAALIIYRILKTYWYITLLLAAAAAGAVGAGLVPPRIMQTLIDTCLKPERVSPAVSVTTGVLIKIAAAYFLSFVFIALFQIIKETVLSIAGQKIGSTLRTAMMRKMTRLHAAYFSMHESGATVSRFTNDIDTVQSLFTNGVVGMIIDLLKIIGIVVSMWMFNSILGLFMLCVLPFVYVLTRFFQKRMLGAQKRKRSIIARVAGFVPETVRSIRMIHAFGKEAYMERKYAECISESYDTIEKINLYDSIYSPIIRTLSSLIIAAVAVLAAARLPFAVITAGMTAASIQYIMDVFEPIGNIGMELQGIQSAIAGIGRINEFLAEPEEPEKNSNAAAVLFQQLRTGGQLTIELRHVTFSYSADTEKILDDVSLVVRPEERVTFAGRTGAGKSTLFNIILGLLVPQSGEVLINGTNIADFPNADKRRLFGVVTQHFDFIRGTVADQIALGDSAVTRDDVERALEFTGMAGYVRSLEKGCDTPASQHLFSQGQLQLLAVSRAVVTNPPVLLLDEITANLDSATEKTLLSVLEKAGRGRTVLSVSHRLSPSLTHRRIITVAGGKLHEES